MRRRRSQAISVISHHVFLLRVEMFCDCWTSVLAHPPTQPRSMMTTMSLIFAFVRVDRRHRVKGQTLFVTADLVEKLGVWSKVCDWPRAPRHRSLQTFICTTFPGSSKSPWGLTFI